MIELPTFPEPETKAWSPLQQAVFAAARQPESLLVSSGPGTGKSTTARQVFFQTPDSLMLAFNASIAKENEAKGCQSKTWHSLFYSVLRKRFRGLKVNGYAAENRISKRMGLDPYSAPEWVRDAAELSRKIRSSGFGILTEETPEAIRAIVESADLWSHDHEDQIALALQKDYTQHVEALRSKTIREIDFADMLWAPVKLGYKLPSFGTVILDEAQDTDPFKLWLLEQITERVIAFGDRHQSIYGFAGAMSNAMDEIYTIFAARELPLNLTYRCSRAVTRAVNEIYPGLETIHDREGLVLPWDPSFDTPQMILCRNKAPLIMFANNMIRAGQPLRLNKPEWLNKLIGYTRGYKTKEDLIKRETKYLEESKKPFVLDRAETLLTLAQANPNLDAVVRRLTQIKRSNHGPLLSTIHSAKGLEARKVLLLREDLIPSCFAEAEEDLVQEENLRYVAYSRAEDTLYRG
jgi:superfamily I DNA/RNA helicase